MPGNSAVARAPPAGRNGSALAAAAMCTRRNVRTGVECREEAPHLRLHQRCSTICAPAPERETPPRRVGPGHLRRLAG